MYEIEGEWIAPPPDISSGDPAVAQWRLNVNDSGNPPGNDPIPDVTATFTLQNGTFDGIPDLCLTTGVTTPSSISPDGQTLVCSLGTVNAGTAISLQTPVIADGPTGSALDITGAIDGQTASPAEIPIDNPFGMDIRWGAPTTYQDIGDGYRDMDFEWTLSLDRGSDPGPQTIVYDLTISSAEASQIQVGPQACSPYAHNDAADGHPWSGGSHPAEQTASFVGTCTLVQTGPTTFQLTLNGINYQPVAPPTRDSAGALLPTDETVVASGSIWIRLIPTQGSGSVQLSSNAPTYTSTTLQTAQDDPANNTSSKTWVGPGIYSSGWGRSYTGSGGSTWDDTYRVSAGSVVAQYMDTGLQLFTDRPDNFPVGMCSALDTRYVDFTGIAWSTVVVAGAVIEYYTGGDPTLDPASASYDPNAFYCGGTGSWSTTPPADLTQVKAVRVTFTQGQAEQYSDSPHVSLVVYQQIKPDTPTGTDVWSSFSGIVDFPGVSDWWNGTGCITPTPGLRYPCTTGFHDLVRIVSAAPSIQKSAADSSVTAGVPEAFTLTYAANGFGTLPPTVDGFTIVDTLPLGMTYVDGSASPAPALSTDPQGRQVLTWTLNGVPTNAEQTLTYDAVADPSVAPGTPLTNTVTASYDGSTTAPATETVVASTNGYTTILKTADDQQVPIAGGTGTVTLPWTVTVRSFDPMPQAFTDTIDILPYNGDGRGTSFSGTAALDAVVLPGGGTVYYTTADPATLTDDPADPSNGVAGDPTGSSAGWSTTPPADLGAVTAIRVIGPALPPGGTFQFQLLMATSGAAAGDVYVNRSQGIAEHTGLVMRTSALIELYEDQLVKDLVSLARNADGTYTAVFSISTTRTGNGPGYDLADSLQYGDSVTLNGTPTAANTVPGDGSITPVNGWDPGTATLTIAADVPIADGITHVYTVTTNVSVDGATVDWASTDCTLQGGETGTGLQNTATLQAEGVAQTASDCTEVPYTIHDKTVSGGPTPLGNGLYEVTYTIDVSNLGAAPDVYDLADDFRFGAAVTIVGTPAVTNTAPGGIGTLGSWDPVATTLAIVDDQSIAAATAGGPAVHSYEVTVQVAVDAPAVTFANTDCTVDGGESGTGLSNASALAVGAYVSTDDACVPISEPVHAKAVAAGSPVARGDGTYEVEYTITVTNAGAAASEYDLDDQFQFGSAVSIVGTPTVANTVPGGIATLGTWDAGSTTLGIVAGEPIAAGTSSAPATHMYTVTVVVDVDGPAVTFAGSDCTLDAGEGGTGLRNSSTMTVNGEPAAQSACAPLSEPVHTKSVSAGPTPLGNNTFQVDYAITVTNAGAAASTYDLTDDFQFGPAVTIVGTPTVANTAPGGIATLGTWDAAGTTLDIVAGQAIDAGAAGGPTTHTYIVTVVVSADLPLATPTNSDCALDQGEEGTGLFNESTLTVNGDDADADACLEFPRPVIDHTKTLTGVTPNGDGTYTVGYSVVVTNNGAGAGVYDLADTLQYGAGVEVVGQPAVTADPGSVALIAGWNGTSATALVDDQAIDPAGVHTYTLTVVVRPDPGTTVGGATDCALAAGETGTGVRNESHLTAPGGVDQVRSTCGELPHVVVDKAISAGPTDLGNGQYQLGYTITVTNDGAGAGAYDLADHLTYGSSVTVASVSILNAAPGGIPLNPGWNGTTDTVVATDVDLAAGGTHTYTVTVVFSVAAGSADAANDCTLEPGESGTGLLNTATVGANGTQRSDVACALVVPPPPAPTTTVPPPATPAPTVPPTLPDPGELPATGGNTAPIGLLAVVSVLFGGLVLLVTRRRRPGTQCS